jgi:peptide-methionine (R)-S-oxide reductase
MQYNQLTPDEERVILRKGTEPPFSGEYDMLFEDGVYVCRRCNTPLYRSSDKFHSGCGWPSFDQEIEGKVKHTPDADSLRTEITCAACGAHLGHVFEDGPTDTGLRYCMNSASLHFSPE